MVSSRRNDGTITQELRYPFAGTAVQFRQESSAYSFTVKAEASNGAAVKYKLINADDKIKIDKTSGKITIKKGLAKGTYSIKVKAYVPGMNEFGYAQETQAIKIVIKK